LGSQEKLLQFVRLLLLVIGLTSCVRALSPTDGLRSDGRTTPVQAAPNAQRTIPGTEVRTLHSELVGQDYTLYVALPFGYGMSEQTYPVVYVLSGDDHFGLTADTARLLRAGGEVPDLIVVGIGYGPEWDVRDLEKNVNRYVNDLTPTSTTRYADLGGSEKFLGFVRAELIPFVDANYRTDPDDRAIIGHSLGGLFALYALFHDPGTFQRYVALSPSLWWDDGVMFEYESTFAKIHSELPARMFLAVGEREDAEWPKLGMVSNLKRFHKRLQDRRYAGLELELVIMADETHQSVVAGATSRGLRWVFR
jgi:predicted alpha/beta superfamily hydrolase